MGSNEGNDNDMSFSLTKVLESSKAEGGGSVASIKPMFV